MCFFSEIFRELIDNNRKKNLHEREEDEKKLFQYTVFCFYSFNCSLTSDDISV